MLQFLSLIGFVIVSMMFGAALVLKDKPKNKCTEVRAYIPVKGKWLEKNICLEGEK